MYSPVKAPFYCDFLLLFQYLYLLFSDDDLISLNQWVFNTEAHPLPIKGANLLYRSAKETGYKADGGVVKAKKSDVLAAAADGLVMGDGK